MEIENALDRSKGFLKVEAFTANRALPVAGAKVDIFKPVNGTWQLIQTMVTNQDGRTPVTVLDTVSKDLSLHPGSRHPYSTYAIRVQAPGFYSYVFENVPIFQDNLAIQTADMVPIPVGERQGNVKYYLEQEPQDL